MFFEQVFKSHIIKVPSDTQIIFVADMFAEHYVGGAELTTQALIESSPYKIFKIKSDSLTSDIINENKDKIWIFGNYTQNIDLIPLIIKNGINYYVLEYDYKYCSYRSPEKHEIITKTKCDCEHQNHGKLFYAFFANAIQIFFMSDKQKNVYIKKFPSLLEKSVTLSSVFEDQTLEHLEKLRSNIKNKKDWIVLGSNSWVKGQDNAIEYCKKHKLTYKVIWNMPYEQTLSELAEAEGFVYLPAGGDTCPRMVIEAKLLDCKLILNDNVQHKDENWFNCNDLEITKTYLKNNKNTFWNYIKKFLSKEEPKISGYVTTYNVLKGEYPFEACIRSLALFCNEICVVDGGWTIK